MEQICLCHADTRSHHCHRRIQPCHIAESLSQQIRQRNPEEEQQQPDHDTDHGGRAQLLHQCFPVVLPCQQHDAVCPREAEEHRQKCRGIKHALVPQNRTRQRNPHEAAVAVNGGKAFDFRFPPRLLPHQQIHCRNKHHVGHRRQQKRPEHIHHKTGLILHVGVGVHHQHRRDNFQYKVGKLPAAVFVHDFCPIGNDAHHVQQQHENCLLQNDPCQIHTPQSQNNACALRKH